MFNTSGAITTNESITDTRESALLNNTRLVTIDLSKIQNNTSGLSPTFKANDAVLALSTASFTFMIAARPPTASIPMDR